MSAPYPTKANHAGQAQAAPARKYTDKRIPTRMDQPQEDQCRNQ